MTLVCEMVAEKACTKCGEIKTAVEFYTNRSGNWCKVCKRKYMNGRNRVKGIKEAKKLDPTAVKKICPKCENIKPVGEFHKRISTSDLLESRCKECVRRPEPIHGSYIRSKAQAKSRGIAFTLSEDFYHSLWDGKCACCLIEIPLPRSGGSMEDSASFDKIDPPLGYIEGNCAWLCGRCNSMKRDGGGQEHLEIAAYIIRHKPHVDPRILTKLNEIFVIIDEDETPLICQAA